MILVTGGSGFIGSHLLDRLAAERLPVRALVRRAAPLAVGVESVRGDLASGEGLAEAVRGAEIVIHLAGATKALTAEGYYSGNVRATENLVRAAAAAGPIRFVYVSSLAACGPSPEGCAIDEEHEPRPISHYGKSKLEAERLVRGTFPDAIVVRPPVVYGPRDTGVLPLLKSVSSGIILEIAGGERWISMIYVQDLIEGLITAAHSPHAAGRTYFMSHPNPVSWQELGTTAARVMGREPRTVRVPAFLAYGVGLAGEFW